MFRPLRLRSVCLVCGWVRAPPWLAVRGSRRGCASPRAASLCGGSRAPRRVSRARAPCAPALRVRSSAPAPALPARSSCLSAFRWCVLLWGTPRAALRCGEFPLCSCRLLRFRFVCVLCDTPPRALFVRASRAMFAVVCSRLSVRGCLFAVVRPRLSPCSRRPCRSLVARCPTNVSVRGCLFAVVRPRLSPCSRRPCRSLVARCPTNVSGHLSVRVPARPRPPSRSFLALLRARARSSRVRLLVPLRFTRAGRFD